MTTWRRPGRGRVFDEDREPAELLDAALAYTLEISMTQVDHWVGSTPAWFGWAIRKAFIYGAVWQRRRALEDGWRTR